MFRFRSYAARVFTTEQLCARALHVLEAALDETRRAPLPKTLSLRFTLAFLYSVAQRDRGTFDAFWQHVTKPLNDPDRAGVDGLGRSAGANASLNGIYRALAIRRSIEVMSAGERAARGRD